MERTARLLIFPILVVSLALLAPVVARAKKRKPPPDYALIAGTVFQKSGFSLRGARVTVRPAPEDGAVVSKKHVWKAVSDARGEFAIRVPAGAMRYTIRVEAKGWQPAEKSVTVHWDEHFDIFFRLKPLAAGTQK